MPVYSAKSSNLLSLGPILDIQVQPTRNAITAMKQSGVAIPPPLTLSAMIDTGASCSVIKTGVPSQLNLHPIGVQHVNTPTSRSVPCPRFSIGMVFPSTAGIKVPVSIDLVMLEAPLSGQNIQCLLGRDLLKHGILVYTGPDDTFAFSL